MEEEIVIVLNPGSTSTKLAIYNQKGEIRSEVICHPQAELDSFKRIAAQAQYRYEKLLPVLQNFLTCSSFKVVGIVARGGIMKPLSGGTYRINDAFLKDAESGIYGEHASNLGCLLANKLVPLYGLKDCYTVDPVSSSNMWKKAEISGVPGIVRVGRGHPLNMKMTARKISELQGIPFEESSYVVAHLGGGISIGLIQGGKIADINDALLGMGPFSPNRAGALPIRGIMKKCYSMTEAEVTELFSKNSGLKAYLGSEDLREVLKKVNEGDEYALLIYEAFVYQIAKEIGAYFAASRGLANAIIITGGIAFCNKLVDDLKNYVGKLTEFHVYPGENEMQALAEGFFRVLRGEEEAKEYD